MTHDFPYSYNMSFRDTVPQSSVDIESFFFLNFTYSLWNV